MVRIQHILPGTIADELSLEIGSRVVRINGEVVRDQIDFRFLEADDQIEVEIVPATGGLPVLYDIEKDAGESLGIVPAPDAVRECARSEERRVGRGGRARCGARRERGQARGVRASV